MTHICHGFSSLYCFIAVLNGCLLLGIQKEEKKVSGHENVKVYLIV